MGITSDREDPRLTRGVDDVPNAQAEMYLVLSDSERNREFIRPLRTTYTHIPCGSNTTMGDALAETFARDPRFYGSAFCVACSMHRPVGVDGEFVWSDDGSKVGT